MITAHLIADSPFTTKKANKHLQLTPTTTLYVSKNKGEAPCPRQFVNSVNVKLPGLSCMKPPGFCETINLRTQRVRKLGKISHRGWKMGRGPGGGNMTVDMS